MNEPKTPIHDAPAEELVEEETERAPKAALSGIALIKNMAANVGGECVYVVTGFILPRLISDRIGPEMLGIWDFGWSMNAHFMLLGGGMMTSVGREVAHLTEARRYDDLRALTSSCFAMFSVCALLVVALALGTAAWLPSLLPTLTEGHYFDARGVVFVLGMCIAVRFPLHVFNGILTGRQQYVTQNMIVSGTHLAITLAVIVMILSGAGLIAMAAAHLVGELLAGLLKLYYSRRASSEWRISMRYVRRETMKYVISFGGKSILGALAGVLLYQTNTILVGRFLGLESLAVFSRARSLVMALDKIVRKATMVFIPNASVLHAQGDDHATAALLRRASEYSFYIAIPGVLFMVIMGEPLLRVWMGAGFSETALLALMAVGHLASITQRGTYFILLGRASHGAPAVASLIAAVVGIGMSLLLMGPMNMGLIGAALAIVIPVTAVDGVVIPWLACRAIGLDLRRYLLSIGVQALRLAAPFALVLLFVRALALASDYQTLGLGLAGSAAVFIVVSWSAIARLRRQREKPVRIPAGLDSVAS